MALSVISSWRRVRRSAVLAVPLPAFIFSMRAWTSASGASGSSGWSASATKRAMSLPPRRPNTTMSSSELVPSRLAPWTETQAHSPAA